MTTTSLESGLRDRAPSNATASRFHSIRAASGALVLLLALPLTAGIEMLFPGHDEVVIHMLLALGTLMLGLSVFDFATPRWVSWIGGAAACALAFIFFLQGLAALTQNEALRSVAFSTELGGWGEAITVSLVMAWLVAVARTQGRGLTMLAGAVPSLLVIAISAWSLFGVPLGGTPPWARAIVLLPMAWLLFVSTRRA